MQTLEEIEARARAGSSARAAVSWRPGPAFDWRGLALFMGALTAMGSSVIVPLLLRQPPADVSSKADRSEVSASSEEIKAARRDCAAALEKAEAAESQSKGANSRIDSLVSPSGKRVARSARPPE